MNLCKKTLTHVSSLPVSLREGDACWGSSSTGQHSRQEGQEEGSGEADGRGQTIGLTPEETRNEGSRNWVSEM